MFRRLFIALVSGFLLAAIAAPAQARANDADTEYLLKAAFIYHFIKFVEWPGDMAISRHPNVNICVLGDNPFGKGAYDLFKRASTSSMRINIVSRHSIDAAVDGSCHVLFIARSEESSLPEIIGSLKGRPVLAVSDISNFVLRGGGFGFITHENKIKLVINSDVANKSGLRIDAQLLEISSKVIGN